ncbi:GNAT family N-acetyltransferase [Vibrio ostreicida]|uniref:GNAT family N-acetyltransferase n=1 Tax=Vibrio ostreicida TaxID=526588 RepID=UPI003B5CB6EC
MIFTENLQLRPVSKDDWVIYSQILSCEELTRFLPKGCAYSQSEIEQHVQSRVEHWKRGFGSYVILKKSEQDRPLGYVGVEICGRPEFSDIRYALLPQFQGRGYAIEASRAVIKETFNLGYHRKIYGVSLQENTGSIAVLKKLGMRSEPSINLYDDYQGLSTFSIQPSDLK